MEPLDSLTRTWASMDDTTRKEAIGSVAAYVVITALGLRSLQRTPTELLRGRRWMWKALIPASVTRISAHQTWVIPAGTLLFWLLGRRRTAT